MAFLVSAGLIVMFIVLSPTDKGRISLIKVHWHDCTIRGGRDTDTVTADRVTDRSII